MKQVKILDNCHLEVLDSARKVFSREKEGRENRIMRHTLFLFSIPRISYGLHGYSNQGANSLRENNICRTLFFTSITKN